MGNNTIDQYIEIILGKECSVCPHNARCEKGLTCDKNKDYQKMIMAGAEWQKQQSPWISVKERLPDYNENIIIMCKHGAIFNGAYCNGVWFYMDGYINDTFKGTPVYSSMASIPPLWEPIAWITIPKFNDSGCSVFPNN